LGDTGAWAAGAWGVAVSQDTSGLIAGASTSDRACGSLSLEIVRKRNLRGKKIASGFQKKQKEETVV